MIREKESNIGVDVRGLRDFRFDEAGELLEL